MSRLARWWHWEHWCGRDPVGCVCEEDAGDHGWWRWKGENMVSEKSAYRLAWYAVCRNCQHTHYKKEKKDVDVDVCVCHVENRIFLFFYL